MIRESDKEPKVSLFEVRDWRTSKYPLRLIIRAIFLTYMWTAMWQVANHVECKNTSFYNVMFSLWINFRQHYEKNC